MKNINKQLGATVRRNVTPIGMFKSRNGFLNLEGSYAYSNINLSGLEDIDKNGDFQKRVMAMVDELKNSKGYKINESIDDDTLDSQMNEVQSYANNEGNKALQTKSRLQKDYGKQFGSALKSELNGWLKSGANGQWNDLFNQYQLANALSIIAVSMKKELDLRQKISDRINSAIKEGDLTLIKSLENEYRTIEQKKQIKDAILFAEAQEKKKEEERLKQQKLDELNSKLANAKTAEERQAIASQISNLTGSVASQFGIPKGMIYFGIGIAVVVGVWITIRAIRKD
jgi:hypothetical protein